MCSWGWQAQTTLPSHWLRWGLQTFFLSWPWTMILWICVSQITRIIGMSYHTRPGLFFVLLSFVLFNYWFILYLL
jgi:hypothetical protein